eukprot:m.230708 g.230708  ORF g.230708 m.230708 type:complete len:54 (+) comp17060_c10_seq1:1690-1851(+)
MSGNTLSSTFLCVGVDALFFAFSLSRDMPMLTLILQKEIVVHLSRLWMNDSNA